MKKLAIVLVTAAIVFPLGVFAGDVVLHGHPYLQKAHHALNDAHHWITRSQEANERVWGDEGGHGRRAKEFIESAKRELDLAAEWVNAHPKN